MTATWAALRSPAASEGLASTCLGRSGIGHRSLFLIRGTCASSPTASNQHPRSGAAHDTVAVDPLGHQPDEIDADSPKCSTDAFRPAPSRRYAERECRQRDPRCGRRRDIARMTLHGYVRALRKHWRLVTACTLACVLAALAATLLQSPVYAARARLFVSVETGTSDTQGLAQGGLFTQQRVKSYADIVNSPQVAAAVIDQLKLKMTPAQLETSISASAPLDTVLIDVTVRNGSPVAARDIANTVATQFGNCLLYTSPSPRDGLLSRMP